jgi:hypothetical protein
VKWNSSSTSASHRGHNILKRRLLHAIDKKNLMKNIYTIGKKNVL